MSHTFSYAAKRLAPIREQARNDEVRACQTERRWLLLKTSLMALLWILSGCRSHHPASSVTGAFGARMQSQALAKPDVASATGSKNAFHNVRLKRAVGASDTPIRGEEGVFTRRGIWSPEAGDAGKELIFPEQVKITCFRTEQFCQELTATLGVTDGLVLLMDVDEKRWSIASWTRERLLAQTASGDSPPLDSERCQRHVLSVDFRSGTVSTSDIPTHVEGCEAFTLTNTYRLQPGRYAIDTSPGNDLDQSR